VKSTKTVGIATTTGAITIIMITMITTAMIVIGAKPADSGHLLAMALRA